MKKLSFACLPLLLLFFSCKKEKASCDLSSTNIVGSYKATAVTYKATPSSTPVDIFAFTDACDKDNIIILNANGTFTYQDAGVKCDPTGDDAGSWNPVGQYSAEWGRVGQTALGCLCLEVYYRYQQLKN